MRKVLLTPFLALLALGLLCPLAQTVSAIDPSVEEHLLNADWAKVTEILDASDTTANDPVARLLLGHACLATNRNNHSLISFESVRSDQREQWLQYTQELVQAHPQSHISHYLLGDAYTRLARYEEAFGSFDAALSKTSKFSLALIARGVIQTLRGDHDAALLDLKKASDLNPQLAEGWAALGTLWIKMKVADPAIAALDKAIRLNNQFALAHLARGVALYGKGLIEQAIAETDIAAGMLPQLSNLAEENRKVLLRAYPDGKDRLTGESDTGHPGSTTEAKVSTFLVDIPGVNWKGEGRDQDWGRLLAKNKETIYVRHEGHKKADWIPPQEKDAVVVTLPNKWDDETAQRLLLPHMAAGYSQGKDVHLVVDKNISLGRHLMPDPTQRGEDEWAGRVTGFIAKNSPANYRGILAEHSRGTVTNDYISGFARFDRVIVSSPRGDDSLSWIQESQALPRRIDIITGLSDAPNWRWQVRYNDLIKTPNVNIIQLQDKGDWDSTHSKLQNLGTEGTYKIMNSFGTTTMKGNLADMLEASITSLEKAPKSRSTVASQPAQIRFKPQDSLYRLPVNPPSDLTKPGMRDNFQSPSAFGKSMTSSFHIPSSTRMPSPPGGVSTQEIEKARVDRGEWPLRVEFGLLYR